jgi:RNA polymerase sigma-70 factor (ECF subfamily)
VHVFLANVMRSLASATRKSRRTNVERPTDLSPDEGSGEVTTDAESPNPNPQKCVESEDAIEQFVGDMEQVFADDPEAQLVLIGLLQDMSREEIQADCELSDTVYETIRRRIRRRLDKRYPEGWKL